MLSTTPKSQEVEVSQRIQETNCGDRISALPDDLLVHILLFIPTKDVVATMLLSKRWRNMWKVVPSLKYEDKKTSTDESVWWFLDKSLQLHKATRLECLCIKLGQRCPIDVDVAKWVANAVDRWVRKLVFDLRWSAEPTSMPKSLYTCETLIKLKLSNKILVDVPSSVFLPSLTKLCLCCVVYQDDVSIVRLLSSCPVLRNLNVFRCKDDDNVKEYSVKVPSLTVLCYVNDRQSLHGNDVADIGRSVVIDCPALKDLYIFDSSRDSCSIGNMPHIDRAVVTFFCYPDRKFLKYLSSATTLSLNLTHRLIMSCTPDNFSQIVHLSIDPFDSDWLKPLMCMLNTNPKIQSLQISYNYENIPFLWNKPDYVPECLTLHLEYFMWYSYKGRKDEKEFVAYILANSKCLKKAEFFLNCKNGEEQKNMTQELKSMFKVSPSCHLRC